MAVPMTRFMLTVSDETGVAVPCRAEAWRDGACLTRVWSTTGRVEINVAAGDPVQIWVRSGIARDAVLFAFDPSTGPAACDVVLRRRFDAPAWGWYGGECHRHAWRSERETPVTLGENGRMGLAEGLDFMLLAQPWDEQGTWLKPTELSRRCEAAAPAGFALGWSLEAPKCPIAEPEGEETGNAHTHGHGWAVGLSDLTAGPGYFVTGPNHPIIQEIHRQGGVVGCAHPARLRLHKGRLTAGWASELPFDYLAGSGYDAMDVLGPAADNPGTTEHVWWALLNLGYRIAATASTGGGAGSATPPGRFRTYVQMSGGFSWRGLIDGIRRGACVASSGPFVLFDIDGAGPGSEHPADGTTRHVALRAWSGALPGEHLAAVQVVRNGVIVQAWNLASQNLREWRGTFEVNENQFAWYSVRAVSSAVDPGGTPTHRTTREVAVASPIYFLPPGYARPAPALARLRVRVTDTADRDVACKVTARVGGVPVATRNVPAGQTDIELPAGARLTFEAPGFVPETRSVFTDSPLGDYCRDLSLTHLALGTAAAWRDMQNMLDHVDLHVRMFRSYDFSNRQPRPRHSTERAHAAATTPHAGQTQGSSLPATPTRSTLP
jgi:hypothetical protein